MSSRNEYTQLGPQLMRHPYGSRVLGTTTEDSDYDIFVLHQTEIVSVTSKDSKVSLLPNMSHFNIIRSTEPYEDGIGYDTNHRTTNFIVRQVLDGPSTITSTCTIMHHFSSIIFDQVSMNDVYSFEKYEAYLAFLHSSATTVLWYNLVPFLVDILRHIPTNENISKSTDFWKEHNREVIPHFDGRDYECKRVSYVLTAAYLAKNILRKHHVPLTEKEKNILIALKKNILPITKLNDIVNNMTHELPATLYKYPPESALITASSVEHEIKNDMFGIKSVANLVKHTYSSTYINLD